MAKIIKLAVACDWIKNGQNDTYEKEGVIFDLLFNAPGPCRDYALDIGVPFSKIAAAYPPGRRIFVTTEPSAHMGYENATLASRIISFYGKYILTSHPQLLKSPLAILKNCSASKWIQNPPKDKIFGIGGFVSAKNTSGFPGYDLRHAILKRSSEIKIPSMIYNHTGSWKGRAFKYPVSTKDAAYKYMFFLAIENYPERGYFTEKLIDCFASRTVPLYFGDPSIGQCFNEKGIIEINRANAISIINSLTEEDYESRKEAMEDNFERSKQHWSLIGSVCHFLGDLFE